MVLDMILTIHESSAARRHWPSRDFQRSAGVEHAFPRIEPGSQRARQSAHRSPGLRNCKWRQIERRGSQRSANRVRRDACTESSRTKHASIKWTQGSTSRSAGREPLRTRVQVTVCVGGRGRGGRVEPSLRHARRRAVPAARASNGVGFRFGVRVRVPVLCRSRRASVDGDGWLPDFHSRARLRAIAGLRIHDRFLLRGVVQATRAQSLCERRIGAQAGGSRGRARTRPTKGSS